MARTDHSGQVLDGRYTLLRLLGAGGMGSVYLGMHALIGRSVAVKFLHSELAGDEELVKRFYREAKAAAAIRHKNIIDVLDVGLAPWGDPYLVMEYLEGESLSNLLARVGPLDLMLAAGIIEPVLAALAAVHAKGIVHRDLKPDNVFLTREPGGPPVVKLIDFGISKFRQGSDSTKLTRTGTLMGTPAYMAPEQARGIGEVDHRADLYAAGVLLYEMLTTALPFTGKSHNDLIVNVLTELPRPPAESYPGFPLEATPVVMKALARDPNERYQSAAEMLAAFRRLIAGRQQGDSLVELAASMSATTFAGGDLGAAIGEAESSAAAERVFAQLPAEMLKPATTPAGWPQTGVGTQTKPPSRIGWVLIPAAVVLVVAVGIGLWFAATRGNGDEDRQKANQFAAEPAAAPVVDPAADLEAKGVAAYDRQDYSVASELFSRALELSPDAVMPRYYLAASYSLLGQSGDAVAALGKLRGAGCEQCLKQIEMARTDKAFAGLWDDVRFREIAQGVAVQVAAVPVIDATRARIHLDAGRKLEKAGSHDAAIAEFRLAQLADPASGKPWAEISFALKNAGRYQEAEEAGLKALELGGDAKFMSNVHFNLGWIMQDTGRKEAAIRYYEQAIAENPSNDYIPVKLKEVRGY